MLLLYYALAMSLVHRAIALSYKSNAHMILEVSGQATNNAAIMMGRHNNNDTATTFSQADSNVTNNTAELNPRARRIAELEVSGIEVSTYLYWDDPEGCPTVLPKCQDCGGFMVLWHRDVLSPSPRCSGLKDEDMKWKDCRCEDYKLPDMHGDPGLPLPDPDESEPDL